MMASAPAAAPGIPRPARYFEFNDLPPTEASSRGSRTWWVRSQSLVVGYTDAAPDDAFETLDHPDEYAVLCLFDGLKMSVQAGDERVEVTRPSVTFVPPGSSTVTTSGGTLVRVFTTCHPSPADRAANAGEYAEADGNVAPFTAWPQPPDGSRVRTYALEDYPPTPGRFGTIFRCTGLMVNVLPQDDQPRDPRKLSPHHHDDFEQVSLQMLGDYVHHMRVPWTPDMTTWRDDEHRQCSGPAVVVIPPPLVHTSQSVGEMRHWLIDLFAPPRHDFSIKPGWVLNADEYPMPCPIETVG
jgi:hypothetical protein